MRFGSLLVLHWISFRACEKIWCEAISHNVRMYHVSASRKWKIPERKSWVGRRVSLHPTCDSIWRTAWTALQPAAKTVHNTIAKSEYSVGYGKGAVYHLLFTVMNLRSQLDWCIPNAVQIVNDLCEFLHVLIVLSGRRGINESDYQKYLPNSVVNTQKAHTNTWLSSQLFIPIELE